MICPKCKIDVKILPSKNNGIIRLACLHTISLIEKKVYDENMKEVDTSEYFSHGMGRGKEE